MVTYKYNVRKTKEPLSKSYISAQPK